MSGKEIEYEGQPTKLTWAKIPPPVWIAISEVEGPSPVVDPQTVAHAARYRYVVPWFVDASRYEVWPAASDERSVMVPDPTAR